MKFIQVFTDGACKKNPGPGGWGFVLEVIGDKNEVLCVHRGHGHPESHTTNNEMELMAIKEALLFMDSNIEVPLGRKAIPINIYTDSQYSVNCMTKWTRQWEKQGWKTAVGKPVKNLDLLKEIMELDVKYCPTYQWIERSSDPRNVEADRLANLGVSEYLGKSHV